MFSATGTLNIGAPADITVLDLREGPFHFKDDYKAVRTSCQRLFRAAAVVAGKKMPDL
jgi:dihydroorotase